MVAEVIINSSAKRLNRTFDYNIPKDLEDYITVGSTVLVPFSNYKEPEEAYVIKIKEKSEFEQEIAKQDIENTENLLDDGEKEAEETYTPVQEEKEEVKVEAPKKVSKPKTDEEVVIEKKPLAPKTEYKSALEDLADGSKKEDKQTEVKKHKKKE